MKPPKRLRILFIAPSLDITGGQAVQASRLLENLRLEDSLEMIFLPINPRIPDFLRRIKYVRTVLNSLVFLGLLLSKVFRCDLLHVFTASYSSYLLWTVPAIVMGKLAGRKVIVNYHDGRAEGHLANWRSTIPTLKLADAIVTPSGYLVDVFARFGIKVQSIFNVIDISRFRFRDRIPLRPVFMTNRGLEPLYNVGCLIQAFALVQQEIPEASLTIAHDGPCRAELEQLVKNLELRQVRFIGQVPQARIADLYDEADIYLMSPNIDNMPLTLLECFASGVPVVSTNAGGVPYLATHGETGLLVDCGDYRAMANCALSLLRNNGMAQKMIAQARLECARYSWSAVGGQWVKLYWQLAGTPERG